MTLTQRAREARETLFQRYDQLNALWLEAEEQLRKFHIPHGICHVYEYYEPDPDRSGPDANLCLGLQKVKGEWRICHGCYRDDFPPFEVEDWTPITECSAEIRVRAAQNLPGLREAVVESAEDFIPKVDDAITSLSEELKPCSDQHLQALLAERAKLNGQAK